MIELKNTSYSYNDGAADSSAALTNVNLNINKGEFIGIAGHTGSGKTTIAQILAGLINPTEGSICVNGQEINDYKEAARALRKIVGIVFQYPEHQLFEETVYRDIAFGPKNRGYSEKEIDICVRESAKLVHLKEEYFDKSPFELSGGQKRRVAIAGVIATKPSVLILDEPAAGLDPIGRRRLFEELHRIRKENGTTIILISHSMEDLAENTERIVLLNDGMIYKDAASKDVFTDVALLEKCGLQLPEITEVLKLLNKNGFDIAENIFSVSEAAAEIAKRMGVLG